MTKVIHLIRSTDVGGSEIVAFQLAEHCKSPSSSTIKSLMVEIHTTENKYASEKKKELSQKGINVITLCKFSKRISLFLAPIRLYFCIKNERPDIIHSHTDLPDFVLSTTIRILLFFKIKPPKIIRTIHNFSLWSTHNLLGKYTERAFINDTIVGVSEIALEAYKNLRIKNKLGLSKYQIIIHNGCQVPIKKTHNFNIDKQKINIAFCGRFENQKGIDVLVDRLRNLPFIDHFIFHIIGNGKYYDKVLKLSQDIPQVILYDPVPNISEKLHDFDFLIMPSRFEGLVLTSIEASYSRVPVIAAIAPGLTETLPPDWPFNFNLENPEELFAILNKIKNREFEIEGLKDIAYDFVSVNFSHSRMIDNYSILYDEITNKREKDIISFAFTPTNSRVFNSSTEYKEQLPN